MRAERAAQTRPALSEHPEPPKHMPVPSPQRLVLPRLLSPQHLLPHPFASAHRLEAQDATIEALLKRLSELLRMQQQIEALMREMKRRVP